MQIAHSSAASAVSAASAGPAESTPSTALLTDHYELTMLDAALRSGAAHRRCVFEVFARRLPGGRRYGVVAGTGRFLDALTRFRFDDDQLRWLSDNKIVDDETRRWLAQYRFSGDVDGYAEGEPFFPGSPILSVEGSFAEAVLLETLVLSIFNHDCAIAAAASRMTCAAGDRPCVEMGSRRSHEEAAVAAARAAYIAGFTATSNLEAGRRYGLPTTGTSAHAFTLVHDDERSAFTAQVSALGAGTTLLVDTYDVETAVRTAVSVAGPSLGAVRIDSGDLVGLARDVRALLDSLGATNTRIIVTSDLDEHAIARLASAPVDGYGVGTSVVTGSGAPTASLVYKLVARAETDSADAALRPVTKSSPGKIGHGGRKQVYREFSPDGIATAEIVCAGVGPRGAGSAGSAGSAGAGERAERRALLVPLVRAGEVVGDEPLAAARERHARERATLPPEALRLQPGDPALETIFKEERVASE